MKDRFMDDFKNPTKYPFYNLKTLDEKLTAWKKLIDEYDACDLKSGK